MTANEIDKEIANKEAEIEELKRQKMALRSEKFLAGAVYEFHYEDRQDIVLCIRVWSRDNWFVFLPIESMRDSNYPSNAQTFDDFLNQYPNVDSINRIYLGQDSLQHIYDLVQKNQDV